ncbi:hypothetical protein TWF730_004040 [Orbilia blumenaviensis]|uniref:Uncharacterized protein n=1 Tax=Orbilia blumenaviensis TaxID=1796055 RepID=A0AAV9U3U1_9PEZI
MMRLQAKNNTRDVLPGVGDVLPDVDLLVPGDVLPGTTLPDGVLLGGTQLDAALN